MPESTVPHRLYRLPLLGLFIVLQAMAPFIHAHAGAMHLHAGFLHLHQGAACGNTAGHALATDDHGVEVTVANGLPARTGIPGVAADVPLAAAIARSGLDSMCCLGARSTASSQAPPARPGHALPFALAPPLA